MNLHCIADPPPSVPSGLRYDNGFVATERETKGAAESPSLPQPASPRLGNPVASPPPSRALRGVEEEVLEPGYAAMLGRTGAPSTCKAAASVPLSGVLLGNLTLAVPN